MGILLPKMWPVPTCHISWAIGTYWACLGIPGPGIPGHAWHAQRVQSRTCSSSESSKVQLSLKFGLGPRNLENSLISILLSLEISEIHATSTDLKKS